MPDKMGEKQKGLIRYYTWRPCRLASPASVLPSSYNNIVYCKGHMDKTKGEGGSRGGRWVWLGRVEGWGENADNYN